MISDKHATFKAEAFQEIKKFFENINIVWFHMRTQKQSTRPITWSLIKVKYCWVVDD